MKFCILVALSKTYLSIKFDTILLKIEEDVSDSRSKFLTFLVTPSRKTVGAIVLKFLSAICQCLKVCLFDLFCKSEQHRRFYDNNNKEVCFLTKKI